MEYEQLVPIKHGAFTLTAAGLEVDGHPPIEQWAEVGHVLALMDRGLAFLIGDWLRYGEAAYGELAAQVIDARTWKPETVRNYVWLSEKVPMANRMLDHGLTVAHHQIIAALPPADQRRWLTAAAAADEPWTVSRLRAAVRNGCDTEANDWYVFVRCSSKEQQNELIRTLRVGGYICRSIEKRRRS